MNPTSPFLSTFGFLLLLSSTHLLVLYLVFFTLVFTQALVLFLCVEPFTRIRCSLLLLDDRQNAAGPFKGFDLVPGSGGEKRTMREEKNVDKKDREVF